jgi:hypothetical protein
MVAEKLTLRGIEVLVATRLGIMKRYTWREVPEKAASLYWLDFADENAKQLPWHPTEVIEAPEGMEMYSDGLRAVPHYTSDWTAIGSLIDWMNTRGMEGDVVGTAFYHRLNRDAGNKCTNSMMGLFRGGLFPVNVCLAALAVMGVEVEVAEEVAAS